MVLEVGSALSRRRYRAEAVRLIDALRAGPRVEIVPLSDDLLDRALTLYGDRPDKEWGLVDCASFVVMTDRGMVNALTADDHFRQAGFIPLLRDTSG